MLPPEQGDDWLGLATEPFDVGAAYQWAVQPSAGAVVLFSGTVRDHAPGRPGVVALTYEAYEEQVQIRLAGIAGELRARWPAVGRIVLLHRVGRLGVGESSVLVVVSAPHRPEAFSAARHAIDTLKATVPIWKYEEWEAGADWGVDAQALPDRAPGTAVR